MPPSARKGDGDCASARWKISGDSKTMLEQEFLRKRFPSPRSKKRLAEELNVEPRRIQVWFQNRRQRERKMKSSSGLTQSTVSPVTSTEDIG